MKAVDKENLWLTQEIHSSKQKRMNYQDLLAWKDWPSLCGSFDPRLFSSAFTPDGKATLEEKYQGVTYPNPALKTPESEVNRLLLSSGRLSDMEQQSILTSDKKTALTRAQKCMLGLRVASGWPCGGPRRLPPKLKGINQEDIVECAAPVVNTSLPFVFENRLADLATKFRACASDAKLLYDIAGVELTDDTIKEMLEKDKANQIAELSDAILALQQLRDAEMKQKKPKWWQVGKKEPVDTAQQASYLANLAALTAQLSEAQLASTEVTPEVRTRLLSQACAAAQERYQTALDTARAAVATCYDKMAKLSIRSPPLAATKQQMLDFLRGERIRLWREQMINEDNCLEARNPDGTCTRDVNQRPLTFITVEPIRRVSQVEDARDMLMRCSPEEIATQLQTPSSVGL